MFSNFVAPQLEKHDLNALLSSSFPESYILSAFNSSTNKLDLISLYLTFLSLSLLGPCCRPHDLSPKLLTKNHTNELEDCMLWVSIQLQVCIFLCNWVSLCWNVYCLALLSHWSSVSMYDRKPSRTCRSQFESSCWKGSMRRYSLSQGSEF